MNKTVLVLLFEAFALKLSAQSDTTWFNEDWEKCEKADASFYRPGPQKEGDKYHVMDYYMTGVKQGESYTYDRHSEIWDGPMVWYYPDGDTFETGMTKKGVAHGKSVRYYENGKVWAVGYSEDNQRQGELTEYYYSGIVRSHGNYMDDKEHGKFSAYYRDGKPAHEGTFKNGIKEGRWTYYYPNGNKKSEYDVVDGNIFGSFAEYNEDGTLHATGNMENDNVISCDINEESYGDKWRREVRQVNGVEEWKVFKNGVLVMEYFYKETYRVGTWKIYSADGKHLIETLKHTAENSTDDSYRQTEFYTPGFHFKAVIRELVDAYSPPSNLNAYYKRMDKNGKVIEEGAYINGEQARNWKVNYDADFEEAEAPFTETIEAYDEDAYDDESYPPIENSWLPPVERKVYVDGDSVFQSVTNFDGVTVISTWCSDIWELKKKRNSSTSKENEILFYFEKHDPDDYGEREYHIKTGNTAGMKLERNVVNVYHLIAVMHQQLPEEKLRKSEIGDAFQKAIVNGEQDDMYDLEIADVTEVEDDGEYSYTIVEQMPEFPGGEKALLEYIATNTKYPQAERDSSIEGSVYVRFVVRKDGTIGNIEIAKGAAEGLNQEAIRVVKSMPRWEPGKQAGKVVSVQFILPIRFKLE